MADHFQSDDEIRIRPYTSSLPYYFQVTVATSSSLNNGGLPYNSSCCAFSVKIHRHDGTTQNCTGIVGNTSLNGNICMARLNYTTHASEGIYHLDFVVTGSVKGSTILPLKRGFSFERLYLER